MAWLSADMDTQEKSLVSTLWCVACRKYERQLTGRKNFFKAWIDGSSNHKTSNIIDHATSEQHKSGIHRDQARSRNELSSTMDPSIREQV